MRKITLPDWVKKLPDNARLNTREIKEVFGYAASCSVSTLVTGGLIPKPTSRCKGPSTSHLQWTVADLKKYERECKIVVDK